MVDNSALKSNDLIYKVNRSNFEQTALAVFQYQYNNNTIYRQFTDAMHIQANSVNSLLKIPFLPISFFKTHKVVTGDIIRTDLVFESSGTMGDIPGRHYIKDAAVYERTLVRGFKKFYGTPENYVIIALLPSYIERRNASLVYMAKILMEKSGHAEGGFYLNEYERLYQVLKDLEHKKQPVLLLGVTFALLDFAAAYPMKLKHTTIMETGGMKGRGEEWTRTQVHEFLQQQWQLKEVHSEYGMTELLSQAYSKGEGIFESPNTMRVYIRDVNDPMDVKTSGSGLINAVDLANINSCSFIATDDLGNIQEDGRFEVLGRADNTLLRGCNLMVL